MEHKTWESERGFYYDEDQDIVYLNIDRLTSDDYLALIRGVDFQYYLTDELDEEGTPLYALKDLQGGNLGDIEDERFTEIEQAIDRMDVYFSEGYEWVTDKTYSEIWNQYAS